MSIELDDVAGLDAAGLAVKKILVDDDLAQATTAGARAVRNLADELKGRGIEVVEAFSLEDGLATVTSDAGLHAIFVNWTLGRNDRKTHEQANKDWAFFTSLAKIDAQ